MVAKTNLKLYCYRVIIVNYKNDFSPARIPIFHLSPQRIPIFLGDITILDKRKLGLEVGVQW
jgi:hypothetical protein